jgi:hypothetical protein
MRPLKCALIFLLSFSPSLWALSLETHSEESSNYLSASLEATSFTLPGGSIQADGARVDFSHFFQNSISFDFFLSTGLNSQSGVSSSFTGLGGYFYYTVWGDFGDVKKTVTVDNQVVLTEKSKKGSSLLLGAGMDQFFLNGSSAVYSVSGVGAGAQLHFPLLGQDIELAGRYSVMSSNSIAIRGLFMSVGICFPLSDF